MKEVKVTKKIYLAKDGKEFLDAKECEKYEDYLDKVLSNIKFFCIYCNPDLTETGNYMHKIYVAVLSKRYYHSDIAFEWALKKFQGYLSEGVQGWGYQPMFSVSECKKEEYDEASPIIWGGSPLKSEKVFLSPESVDGYPENYNYIKEWGFK